MQRFLMMCLNSWNFLTPLLIQLKLTSLDFYVFVLARSDWICQDQTHLVFTRKSMKLYHIYFLSNKF